MIGTVYTEPSREFRPSPFSSIRPAPPHVNPDRGSLPLAILRLAAAEYPAVVVDVHYGDTLTVLHQDRRIRIRLAGIDSPELNQPYGDHARGFTAGLALQTTVTVIEEKPDRYGRMVAWVILPGGRSLNQEIVAAGFAWWYRPSAPADPTLRALESDASHNQRGLWASADSTPPWQWRSDGSHTARSARRDTGRSPSAQARSQRSARAR